MLLSFSRWQQLGPAAEVKPTAAIGPGGDGTELPRWQPNPRDNVAAAMGSAFAVGAANVSPRAGCPRPPGRKKVKG